jgi:hypothetical protein
MSLKSASFPDNLRRAFSGDFRSLILCILLYTILTPQNANGLKLTSRGNCGPFFRRANNSRPAPTGRARGSGENAPRCPGWRSRKGSETSNSNGGPTSSSRRYSNIFSVCAFTRTIFPAGSTTMASSAASRSWRKMPSPRTAFHRRLGHLAIHRSSSVSPVYNFGSPARRKSEEDRNDACVACNFGCKASFFSYATV